MDTPTPHHRWLPLASPPESPAASTKSDSLAELSASDEMLLPLSLSTNPACPVTPPLSGGALGPLTPPTTPEKPADKRGSIISGIETLMRPSSSGLKNGPIFDQLPESEELQDQLKPLERVPDDPQTYSGMYRVNEELGHGAWSNVFRAFEQSGHLSPSTLLPTSPPVSLEAKFQAHKAGVLAVKVPSERMAYKILKKEACILTYLHSHSIASSYIVPFYGFEPSTHTIVMDAIPTTLESLVRSAAKHKFSTKTMFDPVIGAEYWASLAKQLIDGLAFLQSVDCIHGDIKPANILVRSDEATGTLTPLYCDFSSARVNSSETPASETEEISAVTKDYLPPELLKSLLGRNGDRAIATFASDVFALAVTLLAVAIGASPYAAVQMEIQKLSMAKEGIPIEFARQGANGSRVMRGRAVAKILGPAVQKASEKRITVGPWKEMVQEVLQRWEEGGWANGG